jgi:UDP-GlcNAc:undecaprenyl-phosphate GlcNAc-1-phosphate transferase
MELNFTIQIILYILGILIFSILINGILLKFSLNLGERKVENQVRWSSTRKPAFGGISFFIIFLISAVVALFMSYENLDNEIGISTIGFFGATSAGFLMGLADDSYNTKPLLKFSVQFLCGIILVFTENSIELFDNDYLNGLLTIFWVVGLMNSLNMLDNMDAITSSVAAVISSGALLFMLSHKLEHTFDFILILGTFTAFVGFLYYNWNPSRMYMGDSGSQFIGIFLAWVGIKYFWNAPDNFGNEIGGKQFLVPLLLFAVPIADTTAVFINRIRKGRSPFIGGKDHTTHHLFYLGLSNRQVAIVLIAISAICMLAGIIFVNNINDWNWNHFILFGVLFLIVVVGLYSTTLISKPEKHDQEVVSSNKTT